MQGCQPIVILGLGSNLDRPWQQLNKALSALQNLPGSRLLCVSPFYRTQAVGPQYQPRFLNAVAVIRTQLPPLLLLKQLQVIEYRQGKAKKRRHWGPRTLDLDILYYGQKTIHTRTLSVPHPQIAYRDFVQVPLNHLREHDPCPKRQRFYAQLHTLWPYRFKAFNDKLGSFFVAHYCQPKLRGLLIH